MAVNLSLLAPITTSATALANLVLVSPQTTVGYQPGLPPTQGFGPQSPILPPAFLFHYEGEQTVALESDITDHYVEDNTAVQDQIALKPEMVTTHGFIGELNDIPPYALGLLKIAADKLTTIVAYTPAITETAELAYAEATLLYDTAALAANSAIAAWSSINGSGNGQAVIGSSGISTSTSPQNKQQTAFQQFYGYWRSRTLFTIQTPWAVFQNMAIKNLKAIQDADTRMITDFEVSFKMIRTAQTISSPPPSQAQRTAMQGASDVNNGIQSPTPSIGLLQGLINMGAA